MVNTEQKVCRKCGEEFRQSLYTHKGLCRKCLRIIPHCDACGAVMAPEYGFMESFAKRVGGYDLCGFCYGELMEKGFIHPTPSKYLMRSGKIRKKRGIEDDDE